MGASICLAALSRRSFYNKVGPVAAKFQRRRKLKPIRNSPFSLEIEAMNTDPEQPLAQLGSKELSREFKEIYKKIKAVVEK